MRVLEHRFIKPGVSQFPVSSRPETSPERLVWSVKGRLQHLVRAEYPKAFQRNYGLRSLGSASREVVENTWAHRATTIRWPIRACSK